MCIRDRAEVKARAEVERVTEADWEAAAARDSRARPVAGSEEAAADWEKAEARGHPAAD